MSKWAAESKIARVITHGSIAAVTAGSAVPATLAVTGGSGAKHVQATFIDESSNNAPGNLAAYRKAGFTRLVAKAVEGTGYTWSAGNAQADAGHRAGLEVDRYDFGHPGGNAGAECAAFAAQAKPHWKTGDVAWLDIEVTDGVSDATLAAWTKAWLACADTKFGASNVGVYTYTYFITGHPQFRQVIAAAPVWIADYSSREPTNLDDLTIVAWQFTDRGKVAGFPNPMDVSVDLTLTPDTQAPAAGQPSPTSAGTGGHPSNVTAKRNPYPRPRKPLRVCGGKAVGRPVQWAQQVLGQRPTGHVNAALCRGTRAQAHGWGQSFTGRVTKPYVTAAVAHGRG